MEPDSRKLPIIQIGGAGFYVDAVKKTLTDTENRNNTITAFDMLQLDSHFEMLYDKQIRNVKSAGWNDIDRDSERYEYVWLRPFEVYDPEGAKICLEHDDAFIHAALPEIDIEGTKFLWNEQQTLLLQKENPYNRIHKNDMDSKEGIMGFYFDTHKKVVPFPHELKVRPDGVLPPHIHFVPAQEISQKIQSAKDSLHPDFTKRNGRKLR